MEDMHEISKDMQKCIEICNACAQKCKETLIYCIHMGGEHTRPDHLELLMSCAKICRTSADLMTMHSEISHEMCALCAKICKRCAEDCENFADDKEMKSCVKTCKDCEKECRMMAQKE